MWPWTLSKGHTSHLGVGTHMTFLYLCLACSPYIILSHTCQCSQKTSEKVKTCQISTRVVKSPSGGKFLGTPYQNSLRHVAGLHVGTPHPYIAIHTGYYSVYNIEMTQVL